MAKTTPARRAKVAREILRRAEEAHGVTPGWKTRPKAPPVEPDPWDPLEAVEAAHVGDVVFVPDEDLGVFVPPEPAPDRPHWAPPGWKRYGRLKPSGIKWSIAPGVEDIQGLGYWLARGR